MTLSFAPSSRPTGQEAFKEQLEEAARRLSKKHKDPSNKRANEAWGRYLRLIRPKKAQPINADLEEYLTEGERLEWDDGKVRLVLLNKMGGIEIYKRPHTDKDVAQSDIKVKGAEGITRWPVGNLSKNIRRQAFYEGVVVTRIEWVEECQQYKVFFPSRDNPKVGVTVFFPPIYQKARKGRGWKEPRYTSRSEPWVRKPGNKAHPFKSKEWVPQLNREERVLLLAGNKAKVLRILYHRYAKDINARRLCEMDIKEGVERLLRR